jgi:hypothetical protein
VKVRLDPKARQRAKQLVRKLTARNWGVSMERRIRELNRFTVGWTNYLALADTPSVFDELDEWLRRRLRRANLGLRGFTDPYRRLRDATRTAGCGPACPVLWEAPGKPGP